MKLGKKNNDSPRIRVSQGTYQKAIITKVLTQIVIALLALLFVYLIFAATIIRVVPSSAGFVPVKNNTYPGGELPESSQVLVSLKSTPVSESMVGRLSQAFVPQSPSALIHVVAGPIGKITWSDGILFVGGNPINATFPTDPGIDYLNEEYIGICIKGDCTPGSSLIFKDFQVIGVPFNQEAPVPEPINTSVGFDRNNPEMVFGTYIREAYDGNLNGACELVDVNTISELGGIENCKKEAGFVKQKLDREFDFGKFQTTLIEMTDTEATIKYIATFRDGTTRESEVFTLSKDDRGWSVKTPLS